MTLDAIAAAVDRVIVSLEVARYDDATLAETFVLTEAMYLAMRLRRLVLIVRDGGPRG